MCNKSNVSEGNLHVVCNECITAWHGDVTGMTFTWHCKWKEEEKSQQLKGYKAIAAWTTFCAEGDISISITVAYSLCKKASNHHANLPLEMYSLHCNHLGNTWKPLVLMTRHFDYCPSASEGDNQSVRSSAPVVSRCFPGGYNVKLYISRGRLAWWLLDFLCCDCYYHSRSVFFYFCFFLFL